LVFQWQDVETLSPMLFREQSDAQRTIESIDGTARLYELGPSIGTGYVEMFNFADGLAMVVFNCQWKEGRTFEVSDEGRARMSFTLDLNISMDVGSAVIDADTPAWRIMNNAPGVITHETVPAGAKTVWVTLAFHEDYLNRYLSNPDEVRSLPQFEVLRKNPEQSLVQSFPLDHQLNLITSNIISLNAHDSVYVALARAKASELISNALDRMLNESHDAEGSPVRLRSKDREAIKLARDILIANLGEPPSIRELCAAVGVNRNKLHYGFKEEFGMSPLQYLEEYRLEQAYGNLRDSEDLIYQIAAEVGYIETSSFRNAFRRHVGMPATRYRKKRVFFADNFDAQIRKPNN
jgi:AraC-like DNA-binding protein